MTVSHDSQVIDVIRPAISYDVGYDFQLERFYIECRYLLSKTQTYYAAFLLKPTCLPSYLFSHLRDKVKATPHISLTGILNK